MFYKDRIVVVEKLNNSLYLFRRVKNKIIEYSYASNSSDMKENVIIEDSNEEYDLSYFKKDLYIAYINHKKNLTIYNVDKKEIRQVQENLKNNIYELQLIETDNYLNIIYLERVAGEHSNYNIKQIIVEDENIECYLVDNIKSSNFVSPLKAVTVGDRIILSYYYLNHICIKEFDIKNKLWSASVILTDNSNKLYLDFNIVDNYLHLVYSEFSEENFQIKYNRFQLKTDNIVKEDELDISDYGNHTDPIIIYYGASTWVVWKSTNTLLSKYSIDNGKTFSEIISWGESKTSYMVKYKYLTNKDNSGAIIHNTYGSFYPDLKFMGFN